MLGLVDSFANKWLAFLWVQTVQWDATKDISQILDDAENKLNHHLKKKIGENPSLTLPGNYARILLDPKNEQHFTELIDDNVCKDSVSQLQCKFRSMRKVYHSKKPKLQYPEETQACQNNAVLFGKTLLTAFLMPGGQTILTKL